MFATAEKTIKPAVKVQRRAAGSTFFGGSHARASESAETSFFSPTPVQARLSVSMPGDPFEREAESTADRVMSMPDSPTHQLETAASNFDGEQSLIARKEDNVEEEREEPVVQAKRTNTVRRFEDEDAGRVHAASPDVKSVHVASAPGVFGDRCACAQPRLMRKNISMHHSDIVQRSGRGPPLANREFEHTLRNAQGGGEALPENTRGFMEDRFGADFSGVRVHHDGRAQEMTRSIHAHAFTYGSDIYFNSGRYDPDSSAGKSLLAHELTHTIQQGASAVRPSPSAHSFTPVQRSAIRHNETARSAASPQGTVQGATSIAQRTTGIAQRTTGIAQRATSIAQRAPGIVQRAAGIAQRAAAAPQLEQAVTLAQAEQGKVIANKTDAEGNRVGWERLVEFFETTFGKDKIVDAPTGVRGTVWRGHIKKKAKAMGQVPNQNDPQNRELRDAMPSWCGIFVFWSLNKAGVPMPKWRIGESVIKPEAAYPPGYMPKTGDIAYRKLRSHFGIVVRSEGGRIVSVNGNTAGTDNLGGEIQEQTHAPDQWDGFFNPLAIMEGTLRDPANVETDTEPRTLRELRREKFKAQRKETGEEEPSEKEEKEEKLQRSADGAEREEEEEEVQRAADGTEREEEEEEVQRAADGAEREEEEEEVQRAADGTEREEEEEEVQRKAEGAGREEEEEEVQRAAEDAGQEAEEAPPVQRSAIAEGVRRVAPSRPAMLQASWLGDAWDAVTDVVSEVAGYIEQGIDAAKDWLLGKVRDFVMEIPGYKLLRVILQYDPITGESVPRTGEALLAGVLDLIPFGNSTVRSVLDYFQATAPVAAFLLGAVVSFITLIESVGTRFENFWDSLSLDDVGDPDGVIQRIAGLFEGVVSDIVTFAVDCGTTFLTMVKDIAIANVVQFVQTHFPNAFDLLCVVLGENPVTKESVPRTGANILNAGLTVLGERGAQIRAQMMENGIYQKCVAWIDRAIDVVTSTVSDIGQAFTNIWEELSFDSLLHPIDTFLMIVENFRRPVTRVVDFIEDAVIALLKILKDALLRRLSDFAHNTRGYFLITVILGKDVFTGARVPRNAENLIHGFMSLMDGGEEQFRQMKESGAIDRTTQKITAAVKRLNFTWDYIVGLFTSLWESMDWTDFLNPIAAFGRIVKTFAKPILRLIAFIVEIIRIVIEVLMIVMNFPIDLITQIINRVMAVIDAVKRDPIGFLKNLLRAIKQGFIQFFDNILSHLLGGLADWFFHQLGQLGIERPEDLSFRSILKLIMQILGITLEQIMAKVWKKLAEKIGQEKVDRIRSMIDKLEGVWSFIKDVMERGPVAIWEYIQEKLSNLWTLVLDAAKGWIMEKIITAVVTKLLSMLDPTGIMAVINSAIALYRAIQSFIEYLRQLLEIVNSFVQGIAEIASGNIRVAADFLERTLARGIPIVIGFLANQVGLGRIGSKIAEIVGALRAKVDAAIDWLIDKALTLGAKFLETLRDIGKKIAGAIRRWLGLERRFAGGDGAQHRLYFTGSEESPTLMLASNPTAYAGFIKLVTIDAKTEPQKVTARDAALVIAEKIDKKRREKLEGATEEEKEASKAKKVEDVQAMLDDLAKHTALLFGDVGGVDKSEIEHDPPSAGATTFGKSARGFKLAKGKFEPGTLPTRTAHDIYDVLNLRRQADGASYYIRGHLLNHNLGGKGQWYNMTPLSRQGNHQHESQVESTVKAAVDSGAIVEYSVRPKYISRNKAASLRKAFEDKGDQQAETKAAIARAEEHVPEAMQCEAWILEKKGAAFEHKQQILKTAVPNPVEQTPESYHLEGAPPPPPVYLPEATVAQMAAVPEIGDLAAPIAEAHQLLRLLDKQQAFRSYQALSDAKKNAAGEKLFTPEQAGRVRALSGVARVKLFKA